MQKNTFFHIFRITYPQALSSVLKINFFINFVLQALDMSEHSTRLREIGRIRSQIRIRTCDKQILIRETQKHLDPADPDSGSPTLPETLSP